MKKIVSFLMVALLLVNVASFTPKAEATAKIAADDISVEIKGTYSIDEVRESLKELKNGDISIPELHEKYEKQLIPLNLYCSGIDDINKLYGLQFIISTDNTDLAFASVETNIQNGNKIGTSLWSAYLSAQDSEFCEARVLLYGTKEINNELNKSVNMIEEDKYSVATVYMIADKDFKGEANIMVSIEDIASKNNKGTVVSAADSFESLTYFTIKEGKQKDIKISMLGAQIRTKLPQGLRFGTKVELGSTKKKIEDISYGTLIAVTNQLGDNELTLETEQVYHNSVGSIYSEKGSTVVFTGEIKDFPKDGRYDTVNFTARAYVRYKLKGSSKYTVIYADPIIRNVDNIKSKLGKK